MVNAQESIHPAACGSAQEVRVFQEDPES